MATRKQLEQSGYKDVATVTNRTYSLIVNRLGGLGNDEGRVAFVATKNYKYNVFVKTESLGFENEIRGYNNK